MILFAVLLYISIDTRKTFIAMPADNHVYVTTHYNIGTNLQPLVPDNTGYCPKSYLDIPPRENFKPLNNCEVQLSLVADFIFSAYHRNHCVLSDCLYPKSQVVDRISIYAECYLASLKTCCILGTSLPHARPQEEDLRQTWVREIGFKAPDAEKAGYKVRKYF